MSAEGCSATQLGSYALGFLRVDTRPTFIVSVSDELSTDQTVVLFANDALRDAEKKGELSMEWLLSKELLKYGGGSFPTSRWRFTTVVVGRNVVNGNIMNILVVTVTSISGLEWNVGGLSGQFDGSEGSCVQRIVVDDKEQFGDKLAAQITPGTLSEVLSQGAREGRERNKGGAGLGPETNLKACHRTKSPFQIFAAANSSPGPTLLRPQQSGPFIDWTRGFLPLQSSQHYYNLRAVDWSKTKFGPYQTWSTCLRIVANSMMTMPYPTAFYWGPEYTIMYNDEWRKIAQDRDPQLLGKSFEEGWPELKNYFLPLLNAAYYNGEGTIKEAEQLFLRRGNIIEECYFNFAMCAVVGPDGTPEGVLEQAFEHTRHVVSARRMSTLQKMGRLLMAVKDLDEDNFWKLLLEAFDDNPLDSPFLLIYRTVEGKCNAECSTETNVCCVLEGNVGFPEDSLLALGRDKLGEGCDYFSHEMRVARETNKAVVKNLDLSSVRDGGRVVYRGFGDAPTLAVVIPIQATKTITQGFVVLGLNPRRPYDEDYKLWIELLKKELATTAGRASLLKGEIVKAINEESQRIAKIQAVELQAQLQKRTEELRHSELLFTKTAETIPVGLVLISASGRLVFQNDAYFKLTTLAPGSAEDWQQVIYSEDRPRVYELFNEALRSGRSMQWETRVGLDSSNPQGWKYWVTCSIVAQTDKQENGQERVTGYMMTLVDITSIKKNEEYQRQLSTQAVERRRQQENFIDVFSHELRNPFSATLQCADGILGALMEFQGNGEQELDVEEMIDSASTILVCVQHQMRIIDDVLTLSKLDSMLLSVVPVDVQIHESVSQIMKIFQPELQAKGISSKYLLEDSYHELNVDWIKADPSRFSQILMNLITNAIKFTSLQAGRREITTRLGASLERPTCHGAVAYRGCESLRPQDAAHTDWGSGEAVYILVTVKDSGIGISEEWQKKLFKRFEQVPRTHVTYGGSGLGLFICRQLCRIQGGEIGVHSEEGQGSSFSFYIKARRSSCPVNPKASPHQPTIKPSGRPPKFEELATESSIAAGGEGLTMKSYPVPKLLEVDTSVREQLSYNVLIVEDNLINQEVLRRQLRKEGCVTHVAGNGEEALRIITQSGFVKDGGISIDIVLMDMEMPVMDGNTATLKIREMERSGKIKKHVPVMGISANARPEQVAKMTEVGMDDAISKPFRIVDLLVRFDGLLRKLGEHGPPTPPRLRPDCLNGEP